jgi:lysine 2,3-aminomutase
MNETFQQDHTSIRRWSNIPKRKWDDWHWQLQNVVKSTEELQQTLPELPQLPTGPAISEITRTFEMKLTPHVVLNIYRALKSEDVSGLNALMATFVPCVNELPRVEGIEDGIGEEIESSKPAPLVTNFYKTRVLLFATNMCASHCRFCFRRRKIGDKVVKPISLKMFQKAIDYIRQDEKIREVIVSGGDPLIMGDKMLFSLLQRLKEIEHVHVLRIDTKVLTVLPQRITLKFVKELEKFKPIYIVGNFLHSVELTPETINAISMLINVGIPIFAHIALLHGINDDPKIIGDLVWNLYVNRVVPYYLIQFIPTKWTEHFRVPVEKGLEIMEYLHGPFPGIANPTYIIYLPHGGGKVPILPNYIVKHTKEGYLLRNWEGKIFLYPEPS